jgi:hypothetical protein
MKQVDTLYNFALNIFISKSIVEAIKSVDATKFD